MTLLQKQRIGELRGNGVTYAAILVRFQEMERGRRYYFGRVGGGRGADCQKVRFGNAQYLSGERGSQWKL